MLIYNSENECYSRFIPIDQAAEIQEKIKKLEARLQNMPVNPIDQAECTEELDIDDVNSLKKLLKTENFNINMPINHRRASLFLVACYFCSDKEPLEYLLAQGSEINRTDIFGFNAIMSVLLNENMDDETKSIVLQILIDKGCDVNWINCQGKTALMLALERIEPDIANLLLDNGAILYKNGFYFKHPSIYIIALSKLWVARVSFPYLLF